MPRRVPTEPLSDAEILSRYGALFDEADHAFRTDLGYVSDMMERRTALLNMAERNHKAYSRARERAGLPVQSRPLSASSAARRERVARVIELHAEGLRACDIARRLGVPASTVGGDLKWHRENSESRI